MEFYGSSIIHNFSLNHLENHLGMAMNFLISHDFSHENEIDRGVKKWVNVNAAATGTSRTQKNV